MAKNELIVKGQSLLNEVSKLTAILHAHLMERIESDAPPLLRAGADLKAFRGRDEHLPIAVGASRTAAGTGIATPVGSWACTASKVAGNAYLIDDGKSSTASRLWITPASKTRKSEGVIIAAAPRVTSKDLYSGAWTLQTQPVPSTAEVDGSKTVLQATLETAGADSSKVEAPDTGLSTIGVSKENDNSEKEPEKEGELIRAGYFIGEHTYAAEALNEVTGRSPALCRANGQPTRATNVGRSQSLQDTNAANDGGAEYGSKLPGAQMLDPTGMFPQAKIDVVEVVAS